MTHVITRSCCNDAACVSVCPKNCIQPAPGDPGFATAEMLKIDPVNCIDCGACIEVCPVDAIVPDHRLGPDQVEYLQLNAEYFGRSGYDRPGFIEVVTDAPPIRARVAVVGSGPAAMYAVEHLLESLDESSEVHVFERLPVPWGLVRFGVAPDHQDTKQVTRGFERVIRDPRVTLHLGVEVGRDLSHKDLLATHHAVIYGVGAPGARLADVPGNDLTGNVSATDLVAWYNGHPDAPDLSSAQATGRAVVVGNGNVALDVARILASGDLDLASSDIADRALPLAGSFDEVVVVGRRGPAEAAYTTPELLSLARHPHISLEVVGTDEDWTASDDLKAEIVRRTAAGEFASAEKTRRVVLRFLSSPVEVLGDGRMTSIRLSTNQLVTDNNGKTRSEPTGEAVLLDCSLLVHAVGYAGTGVPGVPFSPDDAVIPNERGRVLDGSEPVAGTYVVGWCKRGPSGVIGTNKTCSHETVDLLLADLRSGRLPDPVMDLETLSPQVAQAPGVQTWQLIDEFERNNGRRAGRPRVKVVERPDLAGAGSASGS